MGLFQRPADKERTMATSKDTGGPAFETVRYETKGPICYITLNRPDKLNAASDQLVEEVNDALFEFDADPDLGVAILAGAGRAFCSGADVRQRQLRSPEEMRRLGGPAGRRSRENGLGDTVNWKPAIAAVHGYALGLGYMLAMSCDLVVAAPGTQFQIREVQRGLGGAQHWAVTWFWTGSRFANEIALTGRMFTAEEGLAHGMINRVVPQAELMATAEELARQILENPPLAVRTNVRVMRWFVTEMQRQSRLYTQGRALHLTEDFRESATAFMEKRKPRFKGR
jgi:enoyl-CoA hydratase/carnithine racemase